MIALGIDDGPDATYFPQMLAVLKAKGVLATFFLIGQQISGLESLIVQADADGHLIENHSWVSVFLHSFSFNDDADRFSPLFSVQTHPQMSTLNNSQIATELNYNDAKTKSTISKTPAFFRFPYFDFNANTISQVESMGKIIVDTSLDTKDYQDSNWLTNTWNPAMAKSDSAVESFTVLIHSGLLLCFEIF